MGLRLVLGTGVREHPVEIAFLFPWALVLRESMAGTGAAEGLGIGMFALVEGILFVTILFLGLAYVWVKGDLDWVLSYTKAPYQPPAERQRLSRPSVQELEAALDPTPEDDQTDGDKPDDEEAA